MYIEKLYIEYDQVREYLNHIPKIAVDGGADTGLIDMRGIGMAVVS